jgi:hypothetical protein
LNLSWFVRRRLVDKIYTRLLELAASDMPNEQNVSILYRELRDELNGIDLQSIIRGVDNNLDIDETLSSLGGVDYAEVWREARKGILDLVDEGRNETLWPVAQEVFKLAELNVKFYKASAAEFARVAQTLTPPRDPMQVQRPVPPKRAAKANRPRTRTRNKQTGRPSADAVRR